ncbi:heme-thiolate peroxidase [Xylaria grammica]|uniref:Heme-thiolate peroxidase n=1 Tax=Xylaria grammica TaxID=363999 RepID=A0A439D5T1_9PEZI|nr:heme-thiolate peroxidase [Xylaria grammica]
MKSSSSILPLLALATSLASAFPRYLSQAFLHPRSASEGRTISNGLPGCPFVKRQAAGVTPPFDAKQQYVSNAGKHAFVPPSGSDRRGPCPGLNAMANHGYLPHNGVGTIEDLISGTAEAFGMGIDIATILAIYGAIFDGDLKSFSIGGPAPSLLGLGGLLGEPRGLSGSHNKYEGDGSPIYGDLYQYGNNLPQVSQFTALYKLGQDNEDSVDLDVLTKFRLQRFEQSIAENPYFFLAPFSGVIVTSAAYTFIYRFMANKSAENPEGRLNGETLKSFYAVTGDYPNFTITPGHERFPGNWYKRNPVDYYTIPYFIEDALAMDIQHLQFLSVGGNTGTTNSFVGVEPADLTNGVFNVANLLEGNNAFCFGTELILQMAPDILSGLFHDITKALGTLTSAVGNATLGLSCPQLTSIDKDLFRQFPGYTKLNSNGMYYN